MSEQDVAMKVAEILKKPLADAAGEAADLRMKELPGIVQKEMEGLPGIVRKEMDACLDGKCDAIAERLVAKLPKAEPSTLAIEDVTKAVQAAMEAGESHFTVKGHTAHDILDCPTCKPVIVKKVKKELWEDEEYRKQIMENICEDEACRESMSKMFKEKGLGVTEKGEKDESWAKQRLRERGA